MAALTPRPPVGEVCVVREDGVGRVASTPAGKPRSSPPSLGHFRAHERRELHLPVEILSPLREGRRPAVIVNLSLSGAGIEARELVCGERLTLTISTPTMWDALVVEGIVVWLGASAAATSAPPPRTRGRREAGHRCSDGEDFSHAAIGGVLFDYTSSSTVLAMVEMIAAGDYE